MKLAPEIMKKMFYVCQISENLTLGAIDQYSTQNEAIEMVEKIVAENGVEITNEVKQEIQNDLGYIDVDMLWSVQIGIIG